MIEIDPPPGDPALMRGIGERPARIAGGVLRAMAVTLDLPLHYGACEGSDPSWRNHDRAGAIDSHDAGESGGFAVVLPVLYLWPAQLSVLVAVLLTCALGALLLR